MDCKSTITIDEDFFEHLLNCMANQKYWPTLEQTKYVSEREKEHQSVIDEAYQKARYLWVHNPCNDAPCEECENKGDNEKRIVLNDLSLGVKQILLYCIGKIDVDDVSRIASMISGKSMEDTMLELMEVRKVLRGNHWC